ncbi:AraC family transcriptional regulator [Caballeronia sordidicola]|uniref:AraC family transcriptional regulator n=1 Tax=Caballeronia sordidicola TaxID=196367 RepID=UPI000B78163E|nr:AraC family transcriptional regulator [Caballeronia sordidicola]
MSEEVQYRHSISMPGLTLGTARYAEFRFEPHYHLDYHIGLVGSGVQRQSFRGETLLLTRGAIQLMPPGEVHDGIAASDGPYTLQTFRVSSALLHGLGEEITGKHYFPSQAATVLKDSSLAGQLLKMHTALQHATADRMTNEILVFELLESLFARMKQPSPRRHSGALSPQHLRLVRDFVDAKLADKIVLEDLSLLIGLDRFRFLRLFKRAVGMTPHAWLLRMRLEKAVALMTANRQMPITEIAHAVGFFDQSHFTRVFRDAYGVTPARF